MTDEEIKAMVREAGFVPDWAVENCHEQFKRLVTLVAERAAAAEREWLVEKAESSLNSLDETCSWAAAGYAQGIRDFVAAIRARSMA